MDNSYFEFLYNDIILCGNPKYRKYIPDELQIVFAELNTVIETWHDENFSVSWHDGKLISTRKKSEQTVKEILQDYDFLKANGEPWSKKELTEWENFLEDICSDSAKRAEDRIITTLNLITGRKWDTFTICGTTQDEWNSGYYIPEEWTKKGLLEFEAQYFNTGTEWIIEERSIAPAKPQDIEGSSLYCYHSIGDIEGIRREIADCMAVNPEDVTLFEFAGYIKIASYIQH